MARQTRADAASSADNSSSSTAEFSLRGGLRRLLLHPPPARGAAPSTTLPPASDVGTTEFEDLIEKVKVYPDLLQAKPENIYNDRGTLAPTYDDIDRINDFMLRKMPGSSRTTWFRQKYHLRRRKHTRNCFRRFNSINVPGTPLHNIGRQMARVRIL
ncbi:unnamed protein product [Ectocarpus sp. 4 AP-2014]